jgi:hypothetical protein
MAKPRRKKKKKKEKPVPRRCGAKTTRDTPCTRWAMPNGKCNMHGGKSTGPRDPSKMHGNQNARTHGFYSKGLMPGEAEIYGDVPLGTVDHELRMLRLKLLRLLAAQAQWETQHGLFERNVTADDLPIESHERHVRMSVGTDQPGEAPGGGDRGGMVHQKTIRRKKDFATEIEKTMRLICMFEEERSKLLQTTRSEEFYAEVAQEIREFSDLAAQTVPGGKP